MNKYFRPVFSGFTLKLISTFLFVGGRILIELGFAGTGQETDRGSRLFYMLGNGFLYISLPILCFLAIEGYKHTREIRKYILKLLLVGVITEFIIDYALFGNNFSRYLIGNNLNIFLTLTWGVVMVYLLELVRHYFKDSPVGRNLLTIFLIIVFAGIAIIIGLEYGGGVILTIAAMYLFYGNPFVILLALAAIQIVVLGSAAWMVMYAPIVGGVCTWFYNGERGYKSIASQGFFYSVYPISYVILTLIIKAGA